MYGFTSHCITCIYTNESTALQSVKNITKKKIEREKLFTKIIIYKEVSWVNGEPGADYHVFLNKQEADH